MDTLQLTSVAGILFTAIVTALNLLEHRRGDRTEKRTETEQILARVTDERDQLLREKEAWCQERASLVATNQALNLRLASVLLKENDARNTEEKQ